MQNTTTIPENRRSFLYRFYIYQKERFPFLGHGILISAFSFSAIAYSRICRGEEGFIPLKFFFACIFTTVTLFFLVRIFDEFKDKEEDAKFRKYLPVPRGLISFSELRNAGIIVVILQLILHIWILPKMLILYAVVIGYLLLMGKEFFVSEWLKKRQVAYVISHMMIIPLIDTYASGWDWLRESAAAPFGLLFFFAVSFMNGVVLEVGRKIRAPEKEEEGVLSYTAMYGTNDATVLWIIILFATLLLSFVASWYAGYGATAYVVLSFFFLLCAMPAFIFLANKTQKLSKIIEYSSALWTVAMYLVLGGAPMLHKLITG